MRVAFFGQTGPYAPYALEELFKAPMPYTLALVVEGKRSSQPEFRLHDPRKRTQGDTLAHLALARSVPAFTTTDVNDERSISVIGDHAIDLLVCVGFDRLFKPALLGTARRGGVNAHPSDLPRLRGPAPLYWALREGRKQHALCLHAIDAREDHGPIYAKEWFAPSSLATGDVIFRMAGILAGRMLAPLLATAVHHDLVGAPQDHSRASRAPRPKPEDAFVEPMKWGCEALVRFASGAPYFRAPWLTFGDDTYFIRRGLMAEVGRRLPGEHVRVGDRLIVQCRDGLAHVEVQS